MQRQSLRQGIPLKPDFAAATSATPLIRAAVASLLAHVEHGQTIEVTKRLWPRDQNTAVITKAATAPASMTGTGWADTFVETVVPDFVLNLGPASAAAEVLKRGALQLTYDGTGAFQIPNLTAAAGNTSFVKEADVIPARAFGLDSVTLSPRKLAAICVFNREIVTHSIPAIEKIVGLALVQSAAAALDKAMLDASAGSATRPQGMRFGIAASSTSAKTVRSEAMAEDLATLIAAVAPIAGNYPIFLVASPAQAASLRLWYRPNINYEVFATGQLANGTVLAIASNCVVSAIDPQPRIDTATEGLITLLDDAVPPQFGTPGSPNVVAAPTTSLFQSDRIAQRLICEISWGLRSSGGLSWVQNTLW